MAIMMRTSPPRMRGDASQAERLSALDVICASVCPRPQALSNFTF
jgi:hypothetical protein